MRRPRALRPGSRLAVVAPASPFTREEFEAGVAELRRLGFEAVYDESVFARDGYVAGTPQARAAAIHRAWDDPGIDGLIAARGGYGSVQVLPYLDPARARTATTPFIGYSDVTSLLTFVTQTGGQVAFHGPMLAGRLSVGESAYDRSTLLAALTQAVPMGALPAEGLEVLRPGEASGPLLGGTVSQLLGSLGTPFAFDPPRGFVLWFEEVGERPYRLDRMLEQLKQAGILRRASAVVVGQLPGCDEPGGAPTARETMARGLDGFPGPVVFGLPSGHTRGPALTLPLGVRCRVVTHPFASLIIEESAVD